MLESKYIQYKKNESIKYYKGLIEFISNLQIKSIKLFWFVICWICKKAKLNNGILKYICDRATLFRLPYSTIIFNETNEVEQISPNCYKRSKGNGRVFRTTDQITHHFISLQFPVTWYVCLGG